MEAYPKQIQEGEIVNFDARTSDPVEGVITGFKWDFGDGTSAETVIGYTSHQYTEYGIYNVRVTVTNDQGGEDVSTATIEVNGAPVLNLTIPELVRAGDSALLDASESYDPEGGELLFEWDLNWAEDSDGDTDPRNDVDETGPEVLLPTNRSGLIKASLTISDDDGAQETEIFEINVKARRYEVSWQTQVIEFSWQDYLEQGERWQGNITPGDSGRIMSYEAILELNNDLVAPDDNFTLQLNIVEDGYRKNAETTPGNFTSNESAKAELSDSGMNSPGQDGIYEADSQEELLQFLLAESGSDKGQGTWTWSIVAEQADPDPAIEGFPDPDTGNDWTLTVEVTVLVANLVEIAYE